MWLFDINNTRSIAIPKELSPMWLSLLRHNTHPAVTCFTNPNKRALSDSNPYAVIYNVFTKCICLHVLFEESFQR